MQDMVIRRVSQGKEPCVEWRIAGSAVGGIGRAAGNAVLIDALDREVSRRHAEIRDGTIYPVRSKLTFLNGKALAGPRTLRHGDQLQFGSLDGPIYLVDFAVDATIGPAGVEAALETMPLRRDPPTRDGDVLVHDSMKTVVRPPPLPATPAASPAPVTSGDAERNGTLHIEPLVSDRMLCHWADARRGTMYRAALVGAGIVGAFVLAFLIAVV